MGTKTVTLADATLDELREFGNSTLGLDLGHDNANQARSKIKKAWNKETIIVSAAEPVAEQPSGAQPLEIEGNAVVIEDPNGDRIIEIEVHRQESAGGDEPVFVGVNGKAMWIPRGEICPVPIRFVRVLDNAKQAIYQGAQLNGVDAGLEEKPRIVHIYPYRVVSGDFQQA